MLKNLMSLLTELNVLSIVVRLLMSIFFAGIIGFERQRKHYPAGLRTHILVCIGSTMTTMLGQYAFLTYASDPTRIGAQVVSGIGFLGVGTIVLSGGRVRGITTASGLWTCACMGLMIGLGFYLGACVSFAFVFFTLLVLRNFSKNYSKKHPRQKHLLVSLRERSDLPYVAKQLRMWGVTINHTHIDYSGELQTPEYYQGEFNVLLDITLSEDIGSNMLMANLLQEKNVIYADYTDGVPVDAEGDSEEI